MPFDFELTPDRGGHRPPRTSSSTPAGTLAEAHEGNNAQRTVVEVGPADPSVLVVDDDGGADSEDVYAGALSSLGVPYAVVDAARRRRAR